MEKFRLYTVKCTNGNIALKNRTVRVTKQISELTESEEVLMDTQQVQRTSPVRTIEADRRTV